MTALAWTCCALALVTASLIAWNLMLLRRPPADCRDGGLVSVLIPARNEAANVGDALESVLASRDVDLEVLVLDDHSTDATAAVVAAVARRDARVRLLRGRGLPRGWSGKTFACQQLADAARGDVLIFMDADVRLAPDAVARLACATAPLLSGLPFQITRSFGEKLIVPLMHFVLYGYLPIGPMRRLRARSLGAACGQLIAVKRDAYRGSGGHAAIAGSMHDGIALARWFREAGHATDLADFTALASCRMYRSWPEVVAGFAKNAHEGLGSRRGLVPWTLILLLGQTVPAILLIARWDDPAIRWPALAAVLVAYAARAAAAVRFRQSWTSVVWHPLAVAALVGIQWYALARRVARRPVGWKERKLIEG